MAEQFNEAEKNTIYEQKFAELFNLAVVPFYWSDLEPEDGKPRFAKDSPPIKRSWRLSRWPRRKSLRRTPLTRNTAWIPRCTHCANKPQLQKPRSANRTSPATRCSHSDWSRASSLCCQWPSAQALSKPVAKLSKPTKADRATSRRVGARTVTVALSAEQFAWLKRAVANQRAVWDDLLRMQQLTVEYMLQHLPHPPRRKRLAKKRLGLN